MQRLGRYYDNKYVHVNNFLSYCKTNKTENA